MSLTAVSLFSGAGGLDLGFVRADFEVVGAYELDRYAVRTYTKNFGAGTVRRSNLATVESASLPKADVVFGGPPCQGFSVAGKRDESDPRSRLVYRFVEAVKAVRPRAFVMENVPGLGRGTKFAAVRNEIVSRLEEAGYRTKGVFLNAANYGVASSRERWFLLGVLPSYPLPVVASGGKRRVTAGEVLRSFPPPGTPPNGPASRAKVVPAKRPNLRPSPYAGHLFNGGGRVFDLNRPVPVLAATSGGNRTPIVDELALREGAAPFVEAYLRALRAGRPPLRNAPGRLRRLTVEESAALSGFPPEFAFEGPTSSRYSQIGNAVPPPLAEAVALALRGSLE